MTEEEYGYTCNPDCYGWGVCGANYEETLGKVCIGIPKECRRCTEGDDCLLDIEGRELLDCQRRHGIVYFLVCCCIAVTLSLVMEAVSSRPSLEAQQILTAGARLAGR